MWFVVALLRYVVAHSFNGLQPEARENVVLHPEGGVDAAHGAPVPYGICSVVSVTI